MNSWPTKPSANIIQLTQRQMSQNNFKLPPINSNAPFQVPNDNDILMDSDNNTRSRFKDQKIWDKATSSCRNPLKRFDKFETAVDDKYVPVNSFNNKEKKLIENALQIIQMRKKNKDLVGKNQTLVDILEQKKEMFLVTMTHGIIENQIQNLKGQADDRERALKESDQILMQDMKDFEQFQQREKNQTKNIQQKYEKQVQRRLLKQQQIKSKQIHFNSLRAEKSKNEETISLYEKYKKFLNQLPPEQWKNDLQRKKNERLSKLKEKMFAEWQSNKDLKKNPKLRQEFDAYFQKLKESGDNEQIEEILNTEEMYFKKQDELIEYFNNLEETNLFYIQNVQATDQKLQQLIAKSDEKKNELMNKYKAQMEQKKNLEKQLTELENQVKILKKKRQLNSVIDGKDNKDIKITIANQYMNMKEQMSQAYLPQIQHNAEALTFLSRIEICMERLWQKLRECYNENPKNFKDKKNAYEKKKTQDKREMAVNNNGNEQSRKERNLQKKEPIQKTYGRMDMMRSAPNERAVKKKTVEKSRDINDDMQYLIE